MHISFVTIFPDMYISFCDASLIKKAIESSILHISFVNPRDFVTTKHKQVDDEIYGGGAGMLIKAEPMIDAVQSIITSHWLQAGSAAQPNNTWKIIFLSPSQTIFNQQLAYQYSECEHIIFVSGRYEWIDHRFQQYFTQTYPDNFSLISLGQFVTLGGEVPSMVMTEAIARLIPWVIKEEASHLLESYDPNQNMQNLEYPQYTRPEEVMWLKVPEVLLSGNHAAIDTWRKDAMGQI